MTLGVRDTRRDEESFGRSISRGLTVLQVINRHRPLSMSLIAEQSGIPYPTTRRIVHALINEGMVERETHRKRYRPTALVNSLSVGYQAEDRLDDLAWPLLVELTRKVMWPVYICTRVGHHMMVKVSTDSLTPLTFSHCHPGYTTPLLESSSGKAYLAFCPREELDLIIEGIVRNYKDLDLREAQVDAIMAENARTREQGYASAQYISYTENPGKTSGISLPILDSAGRVSATLSLIFFARTLSAKAAAAKFLPDMAATIAAIRASAAPK